MDDNSFVNMNVTMDDVTINSSSINLDTTIATANSTSCNNDSITSSIVTSPEVVVPTNDAKQQQQQQEHQQLIDNEIQSLMLLSKARKEEKLSNKQIRKQKYFEKQQQKEQQQKLQLQEQEQEQRQPNVKRQKQIHDNSNIQNNVDTSTIVQHNYVSNNTKNKFSDNKNEEKVLQVNDDNDNDEDGIIQEKETQENSKQEEEEEEQQQQQQKQRIKYEQIQLFVESFLPQPPSKQQQQQQQNQQKKRKQQCEYDDCDNEDNNVDYNNNNNNNNNNKNINNDYIYYKCAVLEVTSFLLRWLQSNTNWITWITSIDEIKTNEYQHQQQQQLLHAYKDIINLQEPITTTTVTTTVTSSNTGTDTSTTTTTTTTNECTKKKSTNVDIGRHDNNKYFIAEGTETVRLFIQQQLQVQIQQQKQKKQQLNNNNIIDEQCNIRDETTKTTSNNDFNEYSTPLQSILIKPTLFFNEPVQIIKDLLVEQAEVTVVQTPAVTTTSSLLEKFDETTQFSSVHSSSNNNSYIKILIERIKQFRILLVSLNEQYSSFVLLSNNNINNNNDNSKIISDITKTKSVVSSIHTQQQQQQQQQQSSLSIQPLFHIFIASEQIISSIAGYTVSRGILASGIIPTMYNDAEWLYQYLQHLQVQHQSNSKSKSTSLRILAIDGLNDTNNVGSIIRCSSAFGINCIIVSTNTCSLWSRRSIRVSMGHICRIPCIHLQSSSSLSSLSTSGNLKARTTSSSGNTTNKQHQQSQSASSSSELHTVLQKLHSSPYNVTTYASVVDPPSLTTKYKDKMLILDKIPKDSVSSNWCLVVGNESDGVSSIVQDICHHTIRINMEDNVDSLNVTIATGILLHGLKEREK